MFPDKPLTVVITMLLYLYHFINTFTLIYIIRLAYLYIVLI